VAPPSDVVRIARLQRATESEEPRRPSTSELQPGLGNGLHSVGRAMRRRFERRVRQAGLPLTRLQAALLIRIARNPGLSQTAAASDLDIEPIALVRMIDRLNEEGLVERRPHPTDRRVRTLWLLPLAWPVVSHILEINRAVREEACAGLSPETRRLLMETLSRMKNNLDAADAADAEPVEQLATGEGD